MKNKNLQKTVSDLKPKTNAPWALAQGAKITLLLLATLVGACSVTSLQCSTDGDSSHVSLNTTPKVLSQNARNMALLCAFAYNEDSNETT